MRSAHFHSVLVALDFSDADHGLLTFLANWSEWCSVDRVYLVHITEDLTLLQLPEHLFHLPADEELEQQIRLKAEKYLPDLMPKVQIEVHEGDVYEKILRISRIKECDLLILGQKPVKDGSGLMPRRLLRHSSASVLLVPNQKKYRLDKILTAIDFSEHSALAVQLASGLKGGEAQLYCMHWYRSAFSFMHSAESTREASEHLKRRAEELWHSFKRELQIENAGFLLHPSDGQSAEALVQEAIHSLDADLLVLGSKGQTASLSVLIGSFAEKIADHPMGIPLLIVRKRGENLDLVRWLLDFASH